MKLNMFAYRTRQPISAVDFAEPEDADQIAHWRSHPNLDGWMMALYSAKNGTDAIFNRSTLQLLAADLDALEANVHADALPITEGYRLGVSHADHKKLDLAFITKARRSLAEGFSVYYWCSW